MEPHTGFLNFIVNYILCTYLSYAPTHKRKIYDGVKLTKQLVLCALSRLMWSLTPVRYVYENKILFNSKKMKLQNLQENEWTQNVYYYVKPSNLRIKSMFTLIFGSYYAIFTNIDVNKYMYGYSITRREESRRG